MKHERALLACGCCEGTDILTPLPTANRPGLPQLKYRVGTHATFFESMKARLSTLCLDDAQECKEGQGRRPLRSLTTRLRSDPAIAILDAWATVADVLTFYEERILNEGYLPSATERRSILELARLVGYELRPGVASSVFLAFELEEAYEIEIPAGTRAQSIPSGDKPDELPQFFETSDAIHARAVWNAIRPRQTWPSFITLGNAGDRKQLYLAGTATNLAANDPLLFVFGAAQGEQVLHFVDTATADAERDVTFIELQNPRAGTVDLVADVQTIVADFLNLNQFCLTPGATTGRVINLLANLQQVTTESGLRQILPDVLASLRIEYQAAAGFLRLEPWLAGMVDALDQILNALFGGSPSLPAPAPFSFLELAESLSLAPSIPPANSALLDRDIKTAFAMDADTVPSLLTSLRPELKGTLYAAWASSEITPAPDLKSLEALRVKTAPFGHNAPLRQVLDNENKPIGQEEWPLTGSIISAVQIPLPGTFTTAALSSVGTALHANVSVQMNGSTYQALLPLNDGAAAAFPEANVVLDIAGDVLRFLFTFHDGTRRIIQLDLQSVSGQVFLSVTIDDDIPPNRQDIRFGDSAQYEIARGHRAKVDLSGSVISVVDETLQPPSPLNVVTLDVEYDQVKPGSWVAIQRPDEASPRIFLVEDVQTVSMAAYGLTGKTTQLTLNDDWLTNNDLDLSLFRGTTVYAQSEALDLAEEPITDHVFGDSIALNDIYEGLESGRWMIVTGERADIPGSSGVMGQELVMIAGVTQGVQTIANSNQPLPNDTTHSTVLLAEKLAYCYLRETVTIYANVAKATHGETRQEVLGSGDGQEAFQRFMLKQPPLTYVAAPTAAGAASTLEMRVNNVRWHEEDNLFTLSAADRSFITQTDNEQNTTVISGDGERGARLPTGIENITATHRSGIGKPGNVSAGQISMLVTRPLGVMGVSNPLRASGGAGPESLIMARHNVPLVTRALDRLVSLQDYEDFTRIFAGIGKTRAQMITDGRRRFVHLTIAGAEDIPIDKSSDLFHNLRLALAQNGDPYQPFQVDLRELVAIVISARVRLHADYQWEPVALEIRAALHDALGFDQRELGQDVLLSEVISVIQGVTGVVYVDVDILDGISETTATNPALLAQKLAALTTGAGPVKQPRERLPAELARLDSNGLILPAQLAFLNPETPDTLILTEIS